MCELDKLMEKLGEFANTPLGKEVLAGVAAKPGGGIAQDQGIKPSKDARANDDDSPNNHADLKELAKKLRRPLDTLYALSLGNDPLMVDQALRSIVSGAGRPSLGMPDASPRRKQTYLTRKQPTASLGAHGRVQT
jgi:hypothetical protein